jgi:hypothetical protein
VRATGRAKSPSSAATMPVVEVLPLVPVTPTLQSCSAHSGGSGGGLITSRLPGLPTRVGLRPPTSPKRVLGRRRPARTWEG